MLDGRLQVRGALVLGDRAETVGTLVCGAHGAEVRVVTQDVTAPANTTSILEFSYRPARAVAPFRRQNLRLSVHASNRLVGAAAVRGTLRRAIAVRSRQPLRRGRSGVRIRLVADRSTGAGGFGQRLPSYRRGTSLRVSGNTKPRLRNQVLIVRRAAPPKKGSRQPTIRNEQIKTDRRGRFRYRWDPSRVGAHQLSIHYRRQRGNVTNDRTCPIGVWIGAMARYPRAA